MPSTALPWIDVSLEGHALTVLISGPHVVVYSEVRAANTTPVYDFVHVLGGRTRPGILIGKAELIEELDAIASGAQMPA